MNKHVLCCFVITFAVLLNGCSAGSGEGLDNSGRPISDSTDTPVDDGSSDDNPSNDGNGDETPPANEEPEVTLADLQDEVLTPICAQCHAGNNAPLGLNLGSLEDSEANLINVDSATNSSFKRILPGDPDNSFLYLKIIGDPIAGNRMPLGQTPLSDEVIARFRTWIENGAPVSPSQVQISNVSHIVENNTLTFKIEFNQSIAPESLSTHNLKLDILGNDGVLLPAVPDSVSWFSHRDLIINTSLVGLNGNKIFLTINESSIATVTSSKGYWLDGDYDGQEGGEFTYELVL